MTAGARSTGRTRRRWRRVLARTGVGTAILVLLAVVGFSGYMGHLVAQGTAQNMTREETLANREPFLPDVDRLAQIYELTRSEVSSTRFDHAIPVLELRTDQPARGTVVMVHGMGGTKETVMRPAQMFLEAGFDVAALDQRNSGDNTAPTNSFGVLESYDILDVITQVDEGLEEGQLLVLWGESYGGATAGIALGRDESRIDALILDCPVADGRVFIEQVLQEVQAEQGIPVGYMMAVGTVMNRIEHGWWLGEAEVAPWLTKTSRPTLVLRTMADEVTPPPMGQTLYDAVPHADKQLVTSEEAEHAQIHRDDAELYRRSIEEFLNAL